MTTEAERARRQQVVDAALASVLADLPEGLGPSRTLRLVLGWFVDGKIDAADVVRFTRVKYAEDLEPLGSRA